jgi:hypothetical protein
MQLFINKNEKLKVQGSVRKLIDLPGFLPGFGDKQ